MSYKPSSVHFVRGRANADRPFKVQLPIIGAKPRMLSHSELTTLQEQIEEALDLYVDDSVSYVQVQFLNGSAYRTYTYTDPSGSVRVGDIVEVNTSLAPSSLAKVVALGRDANAYYQGPYKPITARLSREEL